MSLEKIEFWSEFWIYHFDGNGKLPMIKITFTLFLSILPDDRLFLLLLLSSTIWLPGWWTNSIQLTIIAQTNILLISLLLIHDLVTDNFTQIMRADINFVLD